MMADANWPKNARDPIREQKERDAFLLLFHLYNLCEGRTSAAFPLNVMSRDLAFEEGTALQLADLLACGRLLSCQACSVSITEEGINYIACSAGRRRSARIDDLEVPAGTFKLLPSRN